MNKKLLAAAVAAAMVAPGMAAADVTIYGKAHISMNYKDSGSSDYWDLTSNASRLGFKGTEDLGGGLKAIWKMEFQIAIANNNSRINDGDPGSIKMRNSYVGLAGSWGTFLAGRHDTPYKISTSKLDLFVDRAGNAADYNGYLFKNSLYGNSDIRADNAIAYISPSFNGFTFAAALVTAGKATAAATMPYEDLIGYADDYYSGYENDVYATGFDYGNSAANDISNAYSVALLYGNGPFFATVAYETLNEELVGVHSTLESLGLTGDVDKWRFGLGYTANGFHAGFVYENVNGAVDSDAWQLSGSYMFGNNVLKAFYGQHDEDGSYNDLDQWALGIDHNFSKRTTVYALYSQVDYDKRSNVDVFSVGMIHKF